MNSRRDVSPFTDMVERQINMLCAEIVRISSMGYASWGNKDRIRSLDKQIEYLEEMLAGYEADKKKSL